MAVCLTQIRMMSAVARLDTRRPRVELSMDSKVLLLVGITLRVELPMFSMELLASIPLQPPPPLLLPPLQAVDVILLPLLNQVAVLLVGVTNRVELSMVSMELLLVDSMHRVGLPMAS